MLRKWLAFLESSSCVILKEYKTVEGVYVLWYDMQL
jgi:hypothetical protein